MTTEEFKRYLKAHKGEKLDTQLINKLAKQMQEGIFNFMYDSGFEIWNAGCSHRMNVGHGEKDWGVCTSDNPLHSEKEFNTLDGALNYMRKQDEL